MRRADVVALGQAFVAQGWSARLAVLERYWAEQTAGMRAVFVARDSTRVLGYLTRVPQAAHGPFAGQLPELVDFNVFGPYQRQGVGTALMTAAEAGAGPRISLGVGLHAGYGAAQRLRGYVPDGSGLWYRNAPLARGAVCVNDDLVLYLVKEMQEG
ncbi:GNAT family N-acetyltransferase [Lacticaseibacillus absianus]|uniref:GNAT family N-acetyltransferase n=1 Tax=Lacticaseibacillus absianus TaxID=2729623 RepID=UPI0015CDCA3E|nr:GNAT family N-acetyltransferase [Lacticaseibacillus absianus]